MTGLTIRETTADEVGVILALYPQMFPDEDLRPVVRDLLVDKAEALTLGAYLGPELIGHVIFTPFISGQPGALLGPLGVLPAHQRNGVGRALVQHGLAQLEKHGVHQVCVLGDPAVYDRYGFAIESLIKTPYPIPDEWRPAWQSIILANRAALTSQACILPDPWMDPAHWSE